MLSAELIEQILERLPRATIGLVGDLFLDRYWDIDPALGEPSLETRLTAHQVVRVRNAPGALGTVMNNLAALGIGRLIPVTAIGDDCEGYELLRELRQLPAVDPRFITQFSELATPTYTKPMMRSTETHRFDRKNRTHTPTSVEERLLNDLESVWHECDAVIVLDQVSEANCGVVTERLRERIADLAAATPGKFVLADSRERIGLFRNVAIKPNRHECDRAGGIGALRERCGRTVFCTDGEAGIRVATAAVETLVPGYPVAGPVDICGAGDSCSAGILCAKVAGCTEELAGAFGNLVASITVQQIGTTGTATPGQVRERWQQTRCSAPEVARVAKARHLPSVLGCMVGFAFAGCGAGVIPGGWAGAKLRGPVLGPDPTPLADLQWSYGSVYAGCFLGMLVGGMSGMWYARAARRRAALEVEPSAVPNDGEVP